MIRFEDHRDGHEVPVGYTVAQVDPVVVLRFAVETEALGLIEKGTEFGAPQVSDLAYTTVRLHGTGGPQSVRVYALGEKSGSGVSPSEAKARRELSAVIDRARALPGDAASAPYRPAQVRVFELDHTDDADDAPAWPGPAPASFVDPSQEFGACGTLSGSAAEIAYAAARKNPGANWTVGTKQRTLAVVALLPGTIECPPKQARTAASSVAQSPPHLPTRAESPTGSPPTPEGVAQHCARVGGAEGRYQKQQKGQCSSPPGRRHGVRQFHAQSLIGGMSDREAAPDHHGG